MDKRTHILEANDLMLKPLIFYENHLPFELRFSHIDHLKIEINDNDFMNMKVIISGVYIDTKIIDADIDEV